MISRLSSSSLGRRTNTTESKEIVKLITDTIKMVCGRNATVFIYTNPYTDGPNTCDL